LLFEYFAVSIYSIFLRSDRVYKIDKLALDCQSFKFSTAA
jgi:hypothetical protein